MDDVKHKDLQVQIDFKGDNPGAVTADIATLEVWDKDNDWTEPGFFGEQQGVPILWAHQKHHFPIGVGGVKEDGGKARFAGQLNLHEDAITAKEAYATLKFMGPVQEWSYGYALRPGSARSGTKGGRTGRILGGVGGGPGARVVEVSPTLVGAGVGTGTTSVKSRRRLIEEVTDTHESVKALYARLEALKAKRAEDGKQIGAEVVTATRDLVKSLAELEAVLTDPDAPTDGVEARAQFARFQAHLAGVSG